MTTFTKGMRVTSVSSKYPGSGVVDKVNPRTVAVTLDSGHQVRFDPCFLVREGEEPTDLVRIVGGMSGPPATYAPAPQPGTVVRVKPAAVAREPRLAGLWIVCGGQGDKSRLFRLNNKDGRYWRIPNNELDVVNATLTEVGG